MKTTTSIKRIVLSAIVAALLLIATLLLFSRSGRTPTEPHDAALHDAPLHDAVLHNAELDDLAALFTQDDDDWVIESVLTGGYSPVLREQFPIILRHFEHQVQSAGLPAFGAFVLAAHHALAPDLLEHLAALIAEVGTLDPATEWVDPSLSTSAEPLLLLERVLAALPDRRLMRACAVVATAAAEGYSSVWMQEQSRKHGVPVEFLRAAQYLPNGFTLERSSELLVEGTARLAVAVLIDEVLPQEVLVNLLRGETASAKAWGREAILTIMEDDLAQLDLDFLDIRMLFHEDEQTSLEYVRSLPNEQLSLFASASGPDSPDLDEVRQAVLRAAVTDLQTLDSSDENWWDNLLTGDWVVRLFHEMRASMLNMTAEQWADFYEGDFERLPKETAHDAIFRMSALVGWEVVEEYFAGAAQEDLQHFVQSQPRTSLLPVHAAAIAGSFLAKSDEAIRLAQLQNEIRALRSQLQRELIEYAGRDSTTEPQ